MSGPIVPKKALGQNFLISERVARRIIRLANLAPEDTVLEIGPGTGFLTGHLLQAAAKVIAVEMDADLVVRLRRQWPGVLDRRLDIRQADILDVSLDTIAPDRTLQIVGNLPYNIATSVIRRMKRWGHRFHAATFMLQKEVADRILAEAGSRPYGYFTVWTTLAYERKRGFDVRPGCFRPIPRVQSSVLKLIPKPGQVPPELDDLLKKAFQYPRKTLRNNLLEEIPELDAIFRKAGIDSQLRPHQLSPARYETLWKVLTDS